MAVQNLIATPTAAPVTGPWVLKGSPDSCYQAGVDGIGTISATVVVEAANSLTATTGILLGTISLSGATSVTDGFITTGANWKYVRARVIALSGTSALVNVTEGS